MLEANVSKNFIEKCKKEIVKYFNKTADKSAEIPVTIIENDVYVVWYCKTLQNQKALLSTTVPDGLYYECTLNGDKDEIYFDVYKKWENITIKPEQDKDFE